MYIFSFNFVCRTYEYKYTRINLHYLTFNKPTNFVVCSLFFNFFAVLGPKKETLIFAISDFPNLQYARKLKKFVQRFVKVLLESHWKQYSSGHFLIKAVIKREFGI